MKLKTRLELDRLYQTYQNMLTDKQQQIFELYIDDDYSIIEICEMLNITKNGVYNSLKQTEKKLRNLEQALQIVDKHESNIAMLRKYKINEEIIAQIK